MGKMFCNFMIAVMLVAALMPYWAVNRIETAEVTHIKSVIYTPSMDVTGTIESAQSTEIKLSYPVYIKESCVAENSYVNKGQLLFVIDTDKMQEAVKGYNFTEYIDADISMESGALMQLSDKIYATESGYIRNISALDNSIVMAEENLCVIDSDEGVMAKITLNQEDYPKISVGDTVTFSAVSNPEKTYKAVVTDKTGHIRKQAGLTGSKTVVDVFAAIENSDADIVSGLEICGVADKNPVEMCVLPYSYINQDENGQYVLVHKNGTTEKTYIETGRESELYVEVLTPFDADTLFIKTDSEIKDKILLEYEN